MKDENSDEHIMTEFAGFRAKMYALGMDGMEDIIKAKDVKNNVERYGSTITLDI